MIAMGIRIIGKLFHTAFRAFMYRKLSTIFYTAIFVDSKLVLNIVFCMMLISIEQVLLIPQRRIPIR